MSILKSNPKKYLSLLCIFVLIIVTLVLLNKEYTGIRESEAAANNLNLEFKLSTRDNISGAQQDIIAKYESITNVLSTTVLSAPKYSKIKSAAKITIPIVNGKVEVVKKSTKQTYKQVYMWLGESTYDNVKYVSYFALNNGTLTAQINTDSHHFELVSLDAGNVLMVEYDPTTLKRHPDSVASESSTALEEIPSAESIDDLSANNNSQISILAVYTTAFRNSFGNVSNAGWQMESFMNTQVETINTILDNSMIPNVKVNLVDSMQYDFYFPMDLLIYIVNNSSVYPEVHKKRLSSGADVVAVFDYDTTNPTSCGIAKSIDANYADAYFIVNRVGGCLTAYSTFAHEFGHLAGGGHEYPNNGAVSYARASVNPDGKFYTVMAAYTTYGTITREIPFFSTPLIVDARSNLAIGTENTYNNRKRIMSRLGIMSKFVELPTISVTPNPSVPSSSGGTCGSPCTSVTDCDPNGAYTCEDKNTGDGTICWNESLCGGDPLAARIEGYVYSCSGAKLQGVKVKAPSSLWGNEAVTDSNGRYRITKTVDHTNIKTLGTAILAGADATRNANDRYFTNDPTNLDLRSDTPACSDLNCNYVAKDNNNINKLLNSGPARSAYYIPQGLSDDFFEYNFVFTDQYAKSFDFREANCPTPTPTPLPCNSVCTSDAQCSSSNSSWYCATQFNYGTWSDVSSNVSSIQYKVGNNVYTDTGVVTGFNKTMNGNVLEQHLVKSGKVFYIKYQDGAWDPYWQDVTSNLPSLEGATILDFNSYTKPGGKIEQHFVRRTSQGAIQVLSRNNDKGWSSWADVTSNLTDTGTITGFTSYTDKDGYVVQDLVRGGQLQLWERSNINGWANAIWKDISSGLTGCAGTGTNKCGNATLLTVERSINNEGKEELYLIRAGGKVYYRVSTATEERCRLKTNPFSTTCSN